MRDIAKLSLRLMIFAAVAGLALALTNALTEGPIKQRQADAVAAAQKVVLPAASAFEPVALTDAGAYPAIREIYRGGDGEETVGYAFVLAPQGYKGPIELMLGINQAGAVTKLVVNSQSETAGLGTRVAEPPFLSQFPGLAADPEEILGNVDTITGATVSSSAVCEGVMQALSYSKEVLGVTPNADPSLAGGQEMDAEDQRRLAMIEDGNTIQTLNPFGLMGYDAVRGVHRVPLKQGNAYVLDVVVTSKDAIELTVAIGADGKIASVTVEKQNEGVGYGDQVAEPEFLSQFAGQSADAGLKDRVDAITGATYSSSAVIEGINQAAAFYQEHLANQDT